MKGRWVRGKTGAEIECIISTSSMLQETEKKCASSPPSRCHERARRSCSRGREIHACLRNRLIGSFGSLRIVHDLYAAKPHRRKCGKAMWVRIDRLFTIPPSLSPSGFAVNHNLRMNRLNVIFALCSSSRASGLHRAKSLDFQRNSRATRLPGFRPSPRFHRGPKFHKTIDGNPEQRR